MPIVYDDAPAAAPQASSSIVYDPEPDKYQQAAVAERDRLKAAGASLPEGYTRRAMNGPLLGWGDELGAAMMTPFEMARQGTWDPREGYRYAKAREDLANSEASKRTGMAGDAVELASGLATLPGNVFARQASAALGGGRAARMAGYGAEAAAMGGVQGAGSANTMADIPGDAARAAAISGAIGAPFGLAANVARRTTAVTPTEAELSNIGARDYRARDALPVGYDLNGLRGELGQALQDTRLTYGRDAPQTVNKTRDLIAETDADLAAAAAANAGGAPAGSVAAGYSGAPNSWVASATPRDIASLRRELYEAGAKGSDTDTRAGAQAAERIARIMSAPDPAMLANGTNWRDAVTASILHERGRGNFAAGFRSRAVTDEVEKAANTAAGQHSGLNFENILRQGLNRASKADDFRGFNDAEAAGVERLIRQTGKANAQRELGNMLGGGGGLGRMVAMGTGGAGGGAVTAYMTGQDPVMGAGLGLGLGLTGRAIRTHGNYRMRRDTERFAETLRQRSPEYASRVAAAPTEIGPGLSSVPSGARTALTVGDGGAMRDAIAKSLYYQATGQRELPRVYIYGDQQEQ